MTKPDLNTYSGTLGRKHKPHRNKSSWVESGGKGATVVIITADNWTFIFVISLKSTKEQINGKFTPGTRDELKDNGSRCFAGLSVRPGRAWRTLRTDCRPYLHLPERWMRRHPAEAESVLLSAHLLQVGRQQKSRRQELLLFVHHFGLT